MNQSEAKALQNPPETEPIGKLIFKYSVPAIISSLVGSIYNIVDQIFIGNSIGELGNAATNVAFPLVMIITTLAMTFGVGGASSFSLYLGSGNHKSAKSVYYRAWRSIFCIFIVGLQILCAQFFPSIGKGGIGTVVSLLRQVIFLLPLVIIFPMIWGINGVLWAGPIADSAAGIMGLLLVRCEMKKWQ